MAVWTPLELAKCKNKRWYVHCPTININLCSSWIYRILYFWEFINEFVNLHNKFFRYDLLSTSDNTYIVI